MILTYGSPTAQIADMQKSGEDAIALTTVLGVIGAVSLSCGGDTAAAVTRKLLRNY